MTMTSDEMLKRIETLEAQLEMMMQLFLPLIRAEAMAATTISRKWLELKGETFFRENMVKSKKDESTI